MTDNDTKPAYRYNDTHPLKRVKRPATEANQWTPHYEIALPDGTVVGRCSMTGVAGRDNYPWDWGVDDAYASEARPMDRAGNASTLTEAIDYMRSRMDESAWGHPEPPPEAPTPDRPPGWSLTRAVEEQAVTYFTQRYEMAGGKADRERNEYAAHVQAGNTAAMVRDFQTLLRREFEADAWKALLVLAQNRDERQASIMGKFHSWITSPGDKSSTDPFENEAAHLRQHAAINVLGQSLQYLTDMDLRLALSYMSAAEYGSTL